MLRHTSRRLLLLSSITVLILVGASVLGWVGNARAEDEGPTVPRPPRLEPTPVHRDAADLPARAPGAGIESTTVTPVTLPAGDSSIHGMIYYDGYLWASTRTSPGRILKINPGNLTVADRVILDPGMDEAEDIIAANGDIWSVTGYTEPAVLVRVDPATMDTDTFPIDNGINILVYGEALEYKFNKLWVLGYNAIVEVDITGDPTFEFHDLTGIIQDDAVLGTALVSDDNYLWAMFYQVDETPVDPVYISSSVARIDPLAPTPVADVLHLAPFFPDDMVHTNGSLYTSDENLGSPSSAYRFPFDLEPYSTNPIASSESYGVFFNHADPQALWGAYVGSPGVVKKFDLNLNQVVSFNLPNGYNDPAEIVFDDSGNMYVATWQDPTGLVRYTPPDPVVVSISKSGNDVQLSWNNTDGQVDYYEVWRSTDPYFTPGVVGTSPYATVDSSVGSLSYTDMGVLGNVATNYFYVVRAVNNYGLISPISNRVGEFERELRETTNSDFNWIALPLNANLSMASDLAIYIQTNSSAAVTVAAIEFWNPVGQNYQAFVPPSSGNFALTIGGVYRVSVDVASGSSIIWSLLGSVPNIGSYHYTLYETTGSDLNWIMLPLDRSTIAMASDLKANIDATAVPATTVQAVEIWNVVGQNFQSYVPPSGNFSVNIGNPYRISVDVQSGGTSTWP